MRGRVMVLDAGGMARQRAVLLRDRGFAVLVREDPHQAILELTANGTSDESEVLLVGLQLEQASGIELCRHLAAVRPELRVIIVGTERSFEHAVAAMRAGAFDFFAEPVADDELASAIDRALRNRALRAQVKHLRLALAEARGFEELIGGSALMQELYDLMERAAASNASVLITGESGTGKELVARALHRKSIRREGPFVAVNCSAIPEPLLESELFGHVKGAFTDAKVARAGLFVKASGGTLFLDEIGDMPIALQPKLLRALQERRVRPVGGDLESPFDVRVIAATNVNLETAVTERTFREDLYYRINVIHVNVPPLRERASDVLLLAQHFIEHYALATDKSVVALSAETAEKLLAYTWPGNIRELQNCLERAVALTREHQIQVVDLPDKVRNFRRSHAAILQSEPAELVPMEEIERRYIARVLQAVNGNKKEAARVLGLDRKTLYRRLDRYGLATSRDAK